MCRLPRLLCLDTVFPELLWLSARTSCQDSEIGKTVFRIRGSVAASNYIQLPKYVGSCAPSTEVPLACVGPPWLQCVCVRGLLCDPTRGVKAAASPVASASASLPSPASRSSLNLTGRFVYFEVGVST